MPNPTTQFPVLRPKSCVSSSAVRIWHASAWNIQEPVAGQAMHWNLSTCWSSNKEMSEPNDDSAILEIVLD